MTQAVYQCTSANMYTCILALALRYRRVTPKSFFHNMIIRRRSDEGGLRTIVQKPMRIFLLPQSLNKNPTCRMKKRRKSASTLSALDIFRPNKPDSHFHSAHLMEQLLFFVWILRASLGATEMLLLCNQNVTDSSCDNNLFTK